MPKNVFNLRDAVSAKEAKVFFIHDGVRYHWMNARSLKVKGTFENGEIKPLGTYYKFYKNTGAEAEGTIVAYWVNSIAQDIFLNLMKEGVQTFFDVQGVSEDPSARSGKNSWLFTDCVIDGDIPLFEADADGEFLEEEITFKVNGAQKLSGFENETSVVLG